MSAVVRPMAPALAWSTSMVSWGVSSWPLGRTPARPGSLPAMPSSWPRAAISASWPTPPVSCRSQAKEQQRHDHDNGGVDPHPAPALAEHLADLDLVTVAGVIEVAVVPAEEAGLRHALPLGLGLQQGGAQRRRQHQGDEDRQRHRR